MMLKAKAAEFRKENGWSINLLIAYMPQLRMKYCSGQTAMKQEFLEQVHNTQQEYLKE